MRGKFRTDKDGRFVVRTTLPVAYTIPTDGPVGAMLKATGRHPWRPAHTHFVVSAAGFEPVTTHLFESTDKYLDSDTVFGVKDSLICEFARHETADDDGEAVRRGRALLHGGFRFRAEAGAGDGRRWAVNQV